MFRPPTIAVAKMRDLANGEVGRRAALTVGESAARACLRGSSGVLPDPQVAARLCGVGSIERVASIEDSGQTFLDRSDVSILIRSSDPATRQRFTLAHEVGHLILGRLHTDSNPEEELRCDHFARALLTPKGLFKPAAVSSLRYGLVESIVELATSFGVYREVVVKRLADLRVLHGTPLILALLAQKERTWRVQHLVCDRRVYGYVGHGTISNLAGTVGSDSGARLNDIATARSVRLQIAIRSTHGAIAVLPSRVVGRWTSRSEGAQLILGIEPAIDVATGGSTGILARGLQRRLLTTPPT